MIDDPELVEYYKWKGLIERDSGMDIPSLRSAGMPKILTRTFIKEFPILAEGKNIVEDHEGDLIQIDDDEQARKLLMDIYDGIVEAISYYIDMDDDKKKIMALWVIGTYLHDNFETFPLLFLNAMRGSAKSRTVRLLTKLSKDGEMLLSITEAVLFRSTGTLGIDEFESLQSKEKQSVRELLNAAYKKGTQIKRMRKKKTMDGEEQVAESFNAYRPIIISNINGIDEVLSDRCITVILEKSSNESFIQLIEDYDSNPKIRDILLLLKGNQCTKCMNIQKKNLCMYTKWNDFVKNVCTLHTLPTLSTLSTLSTLEERIFNKIKKTGINGRNLELYFPLIQVAFMISEELMDVVLEIAKREVDMKKTEELSDSADVVVYQLVSGFESDNFIKMSELTSTMKIMMGEGNHEWLNGRWMGNALKRLNLTKEKRRVSSGSEVKLNSKKAKDKLEMFK